MFSVKENSFPSLLFDIIELRRFLVENTFLKDFFNSVRFSFETFIWKKAPVAFTAFFSASEKIVLRAERFSKKIWKKNSKKKDFFVFRVEEKWFPSIMRMSWGIFWI